MGYNTLARHFISTSGIRPDAAITAPKKAKELIDWRIQAASVRQLRSMDPPIDGYTGLKAIMTRLSSPLLDPTFANVNRFARTRLPGPAMGWETLLRNSTARSGEF